MKREPKIFLQHIEYFGVDLNLVWKTTQELSNFKQEISKILDNLDGQETIKF